MASRLQQTSMVHACLQGCGLCARAPSRQTMPPGWACTPPACLHIQHRPQRLAQPRLHVCRARAAEPQRRQHLRQAVQEHASSKGLRGEERGSGGGNGSAHCSWPCPRDKEQLVRCGFTKPKVHPCRCSLCAVTNAHARARQLPTPILLPLLHAVCFYTKPAPRPAACPRAA